MYIFFNQPYRRNVRLTTTGPISPNRTQILNESLEIQIFTFIKKEKNHYSRARSESRLLMKKRQSLSDDKTGIKT